MNYWACYAGDYMRDTADLSLAEHGAFFLLMCSAYSTEKPLPESEERLCRMVRATTEEERAAVHTVADRFFPVGSDGLRHNGRVDREIVIARGKRDTARSNGKKGGHPKAKGKPTGFETATQEQPTGFAEQDPMRAADATNTESSPAPTPSPSPASPPAPPPPTAGDLAVTGDISPGLASAFYPDGQQKTEHKDRVNDRPIHVFDSIPDHIVEHSGVAP